MSQLVRKDRKPPPISSAVNATDETLAIMTNSYLSLQEAADSSVAPAEKQATFRCRYHLGTVVDRVRQGPKTL
jgi:hypothetical protein